MQLETAEVHVLVNAAGAQHMWLQWQDLGQPAYASVCSPPFTHRSWPTGTFYNDMRQQGAQDYSDPIRRYNRWARFVVLQWPLSCTKFHGRAAALHYGRTACGTVALPLTCLASCPEYKQKAGSASASCASGVSPPLNYPPHREPRQGARH